jgi:hypothetical protein
MPWPKRAGGPEGADFIPTREGLPVGPYRPGTRLPGLASPTGLRAVACSIKLRRVSGADGMVRQTDELGHVATRPLQRQSPEAIGREA